MLGFSTSAELRLAVWAVIALAVAGSLLYGNYERERANDVVLKDKNAALERKTQDLQLAQDTINGLRSKLTSLTAPGTAPAAAGPPPVIRVRDTTCSRRPQAAAGGAQSAQPPNSGSAGSVLSVDSGSISGEGTDIGPGVQDIARASLLLATYRSELWDWSVKQAQPAK